MKKLPSKERGKFLSTVLICSLIIKLHGLYNVATVGDFTNNPHRAYTFPTWYTPLYVAEILISFVLFYFFLKWKKWTIYVYGVKTLFFIPIILLFEKPNSFYTGKYSIPFATSQIVTAVFLLLLVAISVWAIARKWKYFE